MRCSWASEDFRLSEVREDEVDDLLTFSRESDLLCSPTAASSGRAPLGVTIELRRCGVTLYAAESEPSFRGHSSFV